MMHNQTIRRPVRAAIVLTAASATAWMACSDILPPEQPDTAPFEGIVASNPNAVRAAVWLNAAPDASGVGAVAYIALAPGTAPGGTFAEIRREREAIFASVMDGGFNPVQVAAKSGDLVDVTVKAADGSTILSQAVAINPSRPPVVVRTSPPRKKTGVPLNISIVVVFSEPVAEGTITSTSLRLLQGQRSVAGSVRLLPGDGTVVAFTPATRLARNTSYRLVVDRSVTDRDGDPLESDVVYSFTTGESVAGPPSSIFISADTVRIEGYTYQLTATVQDAAGNVLVDQPVTWSVNSGAENMSISSTGRVTAREPGYAAVEARVNDLVAHAQIIVMGVPTSVTLSPSPVTVAAYDTVHVTATVRDANGKGVIGDPPTLSTSDAGIATVAGPPVLVTFGVWRAVVTGVAAGTATLTAAVGEVTGSTEVSVTPPPPVASVNVTPKTLAIVITAQADLNAEVRDANGQPILNRGVLWTTDDPSVVTVDAIGPSTRVTAVGAGAATVTATASEGVSDQASITVIVLSLTSIVSSDRHSCALDAAGAAYCWGGNRLGELGNGTEEPSFWPTQVSGGHTFESLTIGLSHTCGRTTEGAWYCWGLNLNGQLGDGSFENRRSPVRVNATVTFTQLFAGGGANTCGLTADGEAYCWGIHDGIGVSLGDGTTTTSASPVRVAGDRAYRSLAVGASYACGVTTEGAAYCWGQNRHGQLGDGTTINRSTPVPVSGTLRFTALTAGSVHTCGMTTDGAAYCWGNNIGGQLGDGSTSTSAVPVAVAGGLVFSALSATNRFYVHSHDAVGVLPAPVWGTCGLTVSGDAYCWGWNIGGSLGSGSFQGPERCPNVVGIQDQEECSRRPVRVAGGLKFTSLSRTCGMTTSSVAYCWGSKLIMGIGESSDASAVPLKVGGQP